MCWSVCFAVGGDDMSDTKSLGDSNYSTQMSDLTGLSDLDSMLSKGASSGISSERSRTERSKPVDPEQKHPEATSASNKEDVPLKL